MIDFQCENCKKTNATFANFKANDECHFDITGTRDMFDDIGMDYDLSVDIPCKYCKRTNTIHLYHQ